MGSIPARSALRAGININPVAGLQLPPCTFALRLGGAGININPVAGLQHKAVRGSVIVAAPESTSTQSRDYNEDVAVHPVALAIAGININPVAGLQLTCFMPLRFNRTPESTSTQSRDYNSAKTVAFVFMKKPESTSTQSRDYNFTGLKRMADRKTAGININPVAGLQRSVTWALTQS